MQRMIRPTAHDAYVSRFEKPPESTPRRRLDLCGASLCLRIFEFVGNLGIGQEDLVKTSGAEMLRELPASPHILERHFYRRGILMTAVADHRIAK